MNIELTPKEKFKKAVVQLYDNKPFFSYLVQRLKVIESEDVPTAGVDYNGNMMFNPEWIDNKPFEECMGVACHEAMHVAFKGKDRKQGRDKQLWNIAQDIVINNLLVNNGLQLPDNTLVPEHNTITIKGVTIENLDNHSFESVYNILKRNIDKDDDGKQGQGDGSSEGQGNSDGSNKNSGNNPHGFDEHHYEGTEPEDIDEDETPMGEDDVDWEKALKKAKEEAKNRGNTPRGLDIQLDAKANSEISWKELLWDFVKSSIPTGYTWTRPNKKSRATGDYFPDITKESVKTAVAIDTSGSVTKNELERFVGEVMGIADTFDAVTISIIPHDCKVYDVIDVENASKNDIVEKLDSIQGGGGTSHVPVFEELEKEKYTDLDTVVMFTDGYTKVPDSVRHDVLWCINNRDVEMDRLKHGQIVRIDKM